MASLFSKTLVYLGLVDEDQVEVDLNETGIPAAAEESRRPRMVEPTTPARRVEPPTTTRTALRPSSLRSEGPEVIDVIRPIEMQSDILLIEEFGDARILADRVRDRRPVVLDLRRAGDELTRRVIDFSSGLIYALDGSMRKVGEGLVLVLPPRVRLSRDEKRRLASLGAYELDDLDD